MRRISWSITSPFAGFGRFGDLALELDLLPAQRLGALVEGKRLAISLTGILHRRLFGGDPEAALRICCSRLWISPAETQLLQPFDQIFPRQMRSGDGSSGTQHAGPEPLQLAAVVIDRGNLVVLVLHQRRMIDDGERKHALPQRRYCPGGRARARNGPAARKCRR
jgi:hypothetical protein